MIFLTIDYMNNFENVVSTAFFLIFKIVLIILTIALIFSLLMLAIGCLIKSQKLKSKFLIATPTILFGCIFFILLPYIMIYFKNLN